MSVVLAYARESSRVPRIAGDESMEACGPVVRVTAVLSTSLHASQLSPRVRVDVREGALSKAAVPVRVASCVPSEPRKAPSTAAYQRTTSM